MTTEESALVIADTLWELSCKPYKSNLIRNPDCLEAIERWLCAGINALEEHPLVGELRTTRNGTNTWVVLMPEKTLSCYIGSLPAFYLYNYKQLAEAALGVYSGEHMEGWGEIGHIGTFNQYFKNNLALNMEGAQMGRHVHAVERTTRGINLSFVLRTGVGQLLELLQVGFWAEANYEEMVMDWLIKQNKVLLRLGIGTPWASLIGKEPKYDVRTAVREQEFFSI